MNVDVPLNPQLAQFVSKQLASGRFQSEEELMGEALRLLERQSQQSSRLPNKRDMDDGVTGTPLTHSTPELPGNDVRNPASAANAAAPPKPRSPRGILADIRSHISPDDIKDARMELWSGLPHGDA